MRVVGNHRGARSISFALVAGLVAFEAALALGAGAIGIPGVFLYRLPGEPPPFHATPATAPDGGESVVAKLAAPEATPAESPPPQVKGEPRLDGLADIPLQEWIAPKPKPKPEDAEGAASAEAPREREELPWDAVEPVPLHPVAREAQHADATAALPHNVLEPPQALVPAVAHPDGRAVEGWVKAKAMEVKGPDRARPLYHFEFWLDAPEDVKQRLVAVVYEFNTPAVMPQALMSREKGSDFRVRAGGLTCADKVTVTLKFNDGSSQQVAVDGCRLLG
jgi:hypothetical protein